MHYKIRKDLSIKFDGRALYRIEATEDIERFGVKKGDFGGYIEKERNLTGKAWVGDNAKVYGQGCVRDNAWVGENAIVRGFAVVSKNARVYGNAKVYGDGSVGGRATVCDDAKVYENGLVRGDSTVCGKSKIHGDVRVYGTSCVRRGDLKRNNDIINVTSNFASYNITVTPNHIQIGCELYTKKQLFGFSDSEIRKMDGPRAVDWWKEWKPILKMICEMQERATKEQ